MRKLTDLIILNNLYIAALTIKDRKMKQLLRRITENWFLSEPLMFAAFCTHQLTENNKLTVPFRTGDRRIEYSINVIAALTPEQTEEYLKTEMIRILLKHPYQRQPPFPNRTALTFASNITIAQALSKSNLTNGEATVEGTFAWKNPDIKRQPAGEHDYPVIFTPTE